MRSFFRVFLSLAAIQAFAATSVLAYPMDTSLDAATPFVICENQQYALCAEAACFIYNGVAYCKCDIERGNSISLQLSYSSNTGEQNICDINQQGKTNGYMMSTFSLPKDVEKVVALPFTLAPDLATQGPEWLLP
jgi:hypothetical protein